MLTFQTDAVEIEYRTMFPIKNWRKNKTNYLYNF